MTRPEDRLFVPNGRNRRSIHDIWQKQTGTAATTAPEEDL